MSPRVVVAGLLALVPLLSAVAQTERSSSPEAEHGHAPPVHHARHSGHHRREKADHRRAAGANLSHRAEPTQPPPSKQTTIAAKPSVSAPKPPVGSSTGLPLPRFAALRADEVNLRAGPGTQYPVEWVFKHQDMPVEIEREFDVWRLVEAPDGTKGWLHQATLIGSRTFFVPDDAKSVALRRSPDDRAQAAAILEPEVIGRLLLCDPASRWCRVSVRGVQGYVERSSIWGLLPDEAVGNTP